ncbi:MAG: hypothetical protein WDN31_19685 [Hyphomicrobium sp.]
MFATPELASVGLPEHLASERCKKLDVFKASFRPMKATLSGRDERVFMKLLVDGESGKVVGCHMLGEGGRPRSSRWRRWRCVLGPPRPTSTLR